MTEYIITKADLDKDNYYIGKVDVSKFEGHLKADNCLGYVLFKGSIKVSGSIVFGAGTGIKAGLGIEAGGGIKAGWGIEAGLGIEAGEGIEAVNRIYREDFRYEDRLDRDKSIRICELYLSHWGTHYSKTTGKDVTLEVLARIWNGGPRGYEKNGTIGYWKKVRKAMEEVK